MFKQFNEASRSGKVRGSMPGLADLQAVARIPTRVWGLAKVALIVWTLFMAIGIVARLVSVFRPLRLSRTDTEQAPMPRPIYAIWNFNFINNSPKVLPAEEQADVTA